MASTEIDSVEIAERINILITMSVNEEVSSVLEVTITIPMILLWLV